MKLYGATLIALVFLFGIFTISNILEKPQSEKIQNRHLNIFPQKGIYSTKWTASSEGINDLIRIADETEINTLVIDVKDSGVHLGDYIKSLVSELHQKNIYAIARFVVFQDDSQITNHPDWYFKKSDETLWQDEKGLYWFDPENREAWEFNVSIAKEAIDAGFDEINFDYIRYPAFIKDENVNFPPEDRTVAKNQVINEFAQYLTSELKKYDPEIKLSIDIFAYSMLRTDDLKIGQVFKELYDYFDYICPMIYPSHYLPGNFGFTNPADYPYEVVFNTIESGKAQIPEKDLKKLRPWLQDFNIGAVYNDEMVRKEKQAVYDSGLTAGWLLWNPRNVYTESALDK
ncbi:putative glycoside hydrolase [Patescibacteria group bacterium]|nr:putative glycoside hydrolase [Patescibacteria group bacterium]